MDEADDTQQSTIDNYTGVAIKVSWLGSTSRQWMLKSFPRCLLTRKSTKAYGYNNFRVVRNRLLRSLQVRGRFF